MGDCTKHYYADLPSARRALAMIRKRAKPGAKVPRSVHPCAVCHGWHLTSKKTGWNPKKRKRKPTTP